MDEPIPLRLPDVEVSPLSRANVPRRLWPLYGWTTALLSLLTFATVLGIQLIEAKRALAGERAARADAEQASTKAEEARAVFTPNVARAGAEADSALTRARAVLDDERKAHADADRARVELADANAALVKNAAVAEEELKRFRLQAEVAKTNASRALEEEKKARADAEAAVMTLKPTVEKAVAEVAKLRIDTETSASNLRTAQANEKQAELMNRRLADDIEWQKKARERQEKGYDERLAFLTTENGRLTADMERLRERLAQLMNQPGPKPVAAKVVTAQDIAVGSLLRVRRLIAPGIPFVASEGTDLAERFNAFNVNETVKVLAVDNGRIQIGTGNRKGWIPLSDAPDYLTTKE